MSGIYGNSSEDRHFERMLDEHLNQYDDDEPCDCPYDKVSENEIQMQGNIYNLEDLTDDDYDIICPICGGIMDIEEED
jgi:hypothetical protein